MITIDQSTESTRLILTLNDHPIGVDYTFSIHSSFSNKDYEFVLPDNTSNYPFRYDEFILESQIFKDVEVGQYGYQIIAGDAILEIGIVNVINPTTDEVFVSITPDETEDDLIIYQG